MKECRSHSHCQVRRVYDTRRDWGWLAGFDLSEDFCWYEVVPAAPRLASQSCWSVGLVEAKPKVKNWASLTHEWLVKLGLEGN